MNWHITSWVLLALWAGSIFAIERMHRRRETARIETIRSLVARFRGLATLNRNFSDELKAHMQQLGGDDAVMKDVASAIIGSGTHGAIKAFDRAAEETAQLLLHDQALTPIDKHAYLESTLEQIVHTTITKFGR